MTNSTLASKTPDLPDVHQAVLDTTTLEQLFQDIRECTRVIEVIIKDSAEGYVAETNPSLETARECLMSGAVRGIQVRYIFDNLQWWDTLMQTPDGVRLTRISHDFS